MKEVFSIVVGTTVGTIFTVLTIGAFPALTSHLSLLGFVFGGLFTGLTFLVVSK